MVVKPTGDDVTLLIVMALIALAGVAYVVMGLRALDAQAEAQAQPAAPASA